MNQIENSITLNLLSKVTSVDLVNQFRDEINKALIDEESILEAIKYLVGPAESNCIIKLNLLHNLFHDHHHKIMTKLFDHINLFPDNLILESFFNYLSNEEQILKIKLYKNFMHELENRTSYINWLKIYRWGQEYSIDQTVNIRFIYSIGDFGMILDLYVHEYIKAFSTKYISIVRVEKLINQFIFLKTERVKDFRLKAILNDLDIIEQLILVQKTNFPIPFYAKKAQVIESILSLRINPIFILSIVKFLFLANQEDLIKELLSTDTVKNIDQKIIGRDLYYNDILHRLVGEFSKDELIEEELVDFDIDALPMIEPALNKKINTTSYEDIKFKFENWKNGLDICLLHKNFKQAIEIIDAYSENALDYKILKITLLIKIESFDQAIELIDLLKSDSLDLREQLELMNLEAELFNKMGMSEEAHRIIKKLKQVDPYFHQIRARVDEN